MIRAERMLEAGVGGAGIDQEGVADLADVAEALNGAECRGRAARAVDPDVVPQRVADDLGGGKLRRSGDALLLTARVGSPPAQPAATASGTSARNCSKFSRNIVGELPGLGVIRRGIGPGAAGRQHSGGHVWNARRDLEPEHRVLGELDLVERAGQRGPEHGPRVASFIRVPVP